LRVTNDYSKYSSGDIAWRQSILEIVTHPRSSFELLYELAGDNEYYI